MAIKTLHRMGNSTGLLLDKGDLEQLGVAQGDKVRTTLVGNQIVVEAAPEGVTPSRRSPRPGIHRMSRVAAMESALTEHADVLRTLADASVLGSHRVDAG